MSHARSTSWVKALLLLASQGVRNLQGETAQANDANYCWGQEHVIRPALHDNSQRASVPNGLFKADTAEEGHIL